MSLVPEPKILTIVMNKGGVGKTTCTANLLAALNQTRPKAGLPVVAAIDLDPQCNLSKVLGSDEVYARATEEPLTVADFINPANMQVSSGEFFYEVPREFFEGRAHALFSHPDLETVKDDLEFALKLECRNGAFAREGLFDEALYQQKKGEFFKSFREKLKKDLSGLVDYIVIDTPPSLGFLTQFALAVSDYVLPAISPGTKELDGLYAVEELIGSSWAAYNPNLQVVGILINEIYEREILTRDIKEIVLERYKGKDLFLRGLIPRSVRIGEAISNNLTIFESAHPDSERLKRLYSSIVSELSTRVLWKDSPARAISAEFFYELHFGRQDDLDIEQAKGEVVNG